MAIKEVMMNFANGTTMHGVPKVILSRSASARCFWAIICIAAGSMFCLQMSEVLNRYFSYPKKVTVEVVPTSVPFPSISLCNMRNLDVFILNKINDLFINESDPLININRTDNKFIKEYMKLSAKYGPLWNSPEYQAQYALVFQEMIARTTYSANIDEKIISEAAVQLNQFVVNCYHGENECNLTTDFVKFFDPYYFNCFTYTAADNSNMVLSEGIENGWSSIVYSGSGILKKNKDIRILPGLHESRSPVSANEGVRVVIHPPGTTPFPFTEGFDVPPGFSASFGIQPKRIKRIGPPHGNCSSTNPFTKNNSEIYRLMSCQKMCLQKFIINTCSCKDKTLPDLPDMPALPCRDVGKIPQRCLYEASKMCFKIFQNLFHRIKCIRQTKEKLTKNSQLMQQCKCFPSCDEIYYDVSYSLSKWPANGYEGDAAFFDIFYIYFFRERFMYTSNYKEIKEYFNDTKRVNAMKDFTRLNVYIADGNVIITKEMEDYTSTQLVSDIGGQLGLWVGISIITLAEVLELICDIFKYLFSRKRQKEKPNKRKRVHSYHRPYHPGMHVNENNTESNSGYILTVPNTRINGSVVNLRNQSK